LPVNAVNVTIIESQSGNWWAVQDTVWRYIARGIGCNASIVPQNALDNISNLNNTDVLIVSSATISFANANYLQTVQQFISSGRSAYIQSEYLNTFQGNITFQAIVQALGSDFNWGQTISGQVAIKII